MKNIEALNSVERFVLGDESLQRNKEQLPEFPLQLSIREHDFIIKVILFLIFH